MYKVIAVISDDFNILCETVSGLESIVRYVLPSARANTIKAAQIKIKQNLKKIDVNIIFDDLICEFDAGDEKVLIFKCNLRSFTLHSELKDYEWIPLNKYQDFKIRFDNELIDNWLNNFFAKYLKLKTSIIEVFNKVYEQSDVKIDVRFSLDSLVIFLRGNDSCCPFALSIDYKINDDIVSYQVSWRMVRLYVPGNKTDMYIYFLSSMAALLKLSYNLPVYVFTYNYMGFDFEINAGGICFESDIFEKEINLDEFPVVVTFLFDFFNKTMAEHFSFFGTIANEVIDGEGVKLEEENFFKRLGKYDKICREETTFFYTDKLFYIKLDQNYYKYRELFKNYKYDILNGIDGKLVFQYKIKEKERVDYLENFVDEKIWRTFERIVKGLELKEYNLCIQSNWFLVFTPNGIWGIDGNFHHLFAQGERERLLQRQEDENRLLLINRKFKWKFPLNPTRFEQLIADIFEQINPMAKIRLVGKANNADGGRDILIYEKKQDTDSLTIVQCKAYRQSVNKSNVTDIRDILEYYEADGYYLVTSSNITSTLLDHLTKLKSKFEVDWWTEREIIKLLRQYPIIVNEYRDLIEVID